MKPFRNSSITARLTAMNLLVCLFALVVACAGFITYDVASIRDSIVRTVTSQALIVAQSVSAPLVFNDPDTAQRMLYSLRASPNISGALITDTEHQPFAHYGESIEIPQELRGAELSMLHHNISSNHLVIAAPIRAGDQTVGTLYVVSNMSEMNTRVRRYLLIALGVLVLSVLGGLLVSIRIRKSIADPIVHLANTADAVTKEKNYDMRAESTSEAAELSVLVD
jgi:sensor histidine kinase regulating citrate/malate metabolism